MAKTRNNPTGWPPYRLPARRSTRRTVVGDASSTAPVLPAVAPSIHYSTPLSPDPIAFAPPATHSSTAGAGQSSTVRVDYDEYHAIVTPVSITQTPPLFTTVFTPSTIIHTTTTIGVGPSTSRPPAAATLPTPRPLFLALTVPPSITPLSNPIPAPINPTPTQQPPIPLPSTPLGPPTIHDFDLNLNDTLGEEFHFDFEANASNNPEDLFPFSVPESLDESPQQPPETQTEHELPVEEILVTAPIPEDSDYEDEMAQDLEHAEDVAEEEEEQEEREDFEEEIPDEEVLEVS
ncbi:proline-rich extensin-like protein EPR1 [Cynara cardunculus var. scolymus]|uniref:proline-rich extensin-like protein EPR1 n=1 Tax=Cynara cardunculus var. scolymus TaxID=59895 RepID=UPI000D6243C5|nr:proline-rich extensin-like protein EPR1 [Cynara cardunculus var. scolymus]